MSVRLANATVNGQADDLARRLDNGFVRIYDGTIPTNADTARNSETWIIGTQLL